MHTKTYPAPGLSHVCTAVVHNTAQSSSDYLPSYLPDKHQSSDAVYWREEEPLIWFFI